MATMTIRVDEGVKKSFDNMCDSFGISTSAAINIFMKTVVRERRIPFEIKAESEANVRKRALEAFESMRAAAVASGNADMSLDEINEIIAEVRNGRK